SGGERLSRHRLLVRDLPLSGDGGGRAGCWLRRVGPGALGHAACAAAGRERLPRLAGLLRLLLHLLLLLLLELLLLELLLLLHLLLLRRLRRLELRLRRRRWRWWRWRGRHGAGRHRCGGAAVRRRARLADA